jgi:Uma2 family endonuclease
MTLVAEAPVAEMAVAKKTVAEMAVAETPPAEESPPAEPAQIVLNGDYARYLAESEAHPDLRVEFLDGEILMTPAPRPIHQLIVEKLMQHLGVYVWTNQLGRLLPAPVDVELEPEARMVQPDLVFIAADRVADLIGEGHIHGAPDLVVEILSPSTAHTDRHRKLPRYAASGIPELWLLDPGDQALELYLLSEEQPENYILAGVYVDEDVIAAGRFADAQIPVSALFEV